VIQARPLPPFQLPAIVARIGARLPQWPHAAVLSLALNAALRVRLLPGERLAQLEGRTFLIVVSDTGCRAAFTFVNGRFRPLFNFRDTADISFTATLSVFMRLLARTEDPDTLFFNRELSVEGDTELGLIIKNMLDAVDLPRPA
jgi:predicted lipid carrier protein YhbT